MAKFGVKYLEKWTSAFVRLGLYFFLYHVDRPPIAFWYGMFLYLELRSFYCFKKTEKSHFFGFFTTLNFKV